MCGDIKPYRRALDWGKGDTKLYLQSKFSSKSYFLVHFAGLKYVCFPFSKRKIYDVDI